VSTPEDQHPTARLTRAEVEVPASPEEVWQAIATGQGNAAWMFPAEIEGRVGGTIMMHRGPYGGDAVATVTAWEPPRRFAYEEAVEGPDGPAKEPWATEFLVEARGGGTCVVRVVSGFFRDGEGWEEMVEGAGEGWRFGLIILRAYLTHFANQFAGQPAVGLDVTGNTGEPLAERSKVSATLMDAFGLTGRSAGDSFRAPSDAPPLAGALETASEHGVLLRSDEPGPGLVEVSTFSMDGATVTVNLSAHPNGPRARELAERDQPRWAAWLQDRFPALTMSP
jgi:uncharacterized protein YndB with AHSA1/START domain